jgi:hypothetical protein
MILYKYILSIHKIKYMNRSIIVSADKLKHNLLKKLLHEYVNANLHRLK